MKSEFPVALVTGGSRRIGAAICRDLHKVGFNIVIHFNQSEGSATALAQELNQIRANSAAIARADLNDMNQISELAIFVQTIWGRVDALINNASTFYPTPVTESPTAAWDDLMNSNLKAPYFLSLALVPALMQQRGSIINMADIFAERPMPNHSIYSIAKAGNLMLTQSLALELGPHIRVNGVAPGAILWPEDADGQEKVNPEKLQHIPLGRLGGAQSIAEAVRFLITGASYITGQIIRVDGGRSLR
jgi:pteridine reductase